MPGVNARQAVAKPAGSAKGGSTNTRAGGAAAMRATSSSSVAADSTHKPRAAAAAAAPSAGGLPAAPAAPAQQQTVLDSARVTQRRQPATSPAATPTGRGSHGSATTQGRSARGSVLTPDNSTSSTVERPATTAASTAGVQGQGPGQGQSSTTGRAQQISQARGRRQVNGTQSASAPGVPLPEGKASAPGKAVGGDAAGAVGGSKAAADESASGSLRSSHSFDAALEQCAIQQEVELLLVAWLGGRRHSPQQGTVQPSRHRAQEQGGQVVKGQHAPPGDAGLQASLTAPGSGDSNSGFCVTAEQLEAAVKKLALLGSSPGHDKSALSSGRDSNSAVGSGGSRVSDLVKTALTAHWQHPLESPSTALRAAALLQSLAALGSAYYDRCARQHS